MVNRFLAKGYFPKEIPACFSSRAAARALAVKPSVVPTLNQHLSAAPVTFSLARAGGVRRALAIQNPVLHYHLAEIIVGGWKQLRRAMDASPITISAARIRNAQRRAVAPATPWRQVYLKQLEQRRRGQYVLSTDLAECYRSIYTHSIAWAIEGKSIAQARHNDYTLLGNRIDRAVRNAQSRQTNGLPVGPDTSLVLAEVVLSQVDQRIESELGRRHLRGYRFYDDYELIFDNRVDAEYALSVVEYACRQYGFHLNPGKTRIEPLPLRLERSWIQTVRAFEFRSGEKGMPDRLVQFFDAVFEQKAADSESNVVTFALRRLEGVVFNDEEWKLAQLFMYQAVGGEPASVEQLMKTLDAQFAAGRTIHIQMLQEYISDTLVRRAPLGHSFEVTWCLWGAIRFGVHITRQAAASLTRSWDDVTALLSLDAQARGLIGKGALDTAIYQSACDSSTLRDEHWLLRYETSVRGWLDGSAAQSLTVCPAFQFLAASNVRFYRRFHAVRASDGARKARAREGFFRWTGRDDDDDSSEY